MRKIVLLLSLLMSVPVWAQEKPLIASAVIAQRDNDLLEAKRYLDEADEVISKKSEGDVKSKIMSKFLYYKGLVYFQIFNSQDGSVKASAPNALDVASEAFTKLLEYERKTGDREYSDEASMQMPYIANAYASRGIERNNAKDYMGAYEDFMTTYELKKNPPINETDTAMLYNASIMAQSAKDFKKAIEINEKLINMNFRSIEYKATDVESGQEVAFSTKNQLELAVKAGSVKDPVIEGDIRADLYGLVANLYLQEGDTATFKRYINEGRNRFPENAQLLRSELQLFLDDKRYTEAMSNLNQAIANEPNNKLYYYIKGYILQTEMDSVEAAKQAYDEAIKLDSNYVEAVYMRGLIHVNRANELTLEMNQLKLNEKSKYDKLEKEQQKEFQASLPYFQQVYEVAPKDTDNLNALKEVYYKLKMYEQAKKINGELEALK